MHSFGIFGTMLVLLERCTFRNKSNVFRRMLFHSTAREAQQNESDIMLHPNDTVAQHNERRKFLKVAILGLPNAGKSTLINSLTERWVCPTSSKVHTTTHNADAIYVAGDTQIVFIDTPGIVTRSEISKYKLVKNMAEDPKNSINEADVVGVLQDASNMYTRHKIAECTLNILKEKREDIPLLLILNKVDKIKSKGMLLDIIKKFINDETIPKFTDIFMISALTRNGVEDLRNYLLDSAKENDWQYGNDLYVNQQFETIFKQTLRAKMMDVLIAEIPYKVDLEIEHFDIGEDGSMSTIMLVRCPVERYKKLLLRGNPSKIKIIATLTETDLQRAFRTTVRVRLNVVCKGKPNGTNPNL